MTTYSNLTAPIDACTWLGPEWANRSGNRIGHASIEDRPFFLSDRDVIVWKNPKSWKMIATIPAGEPILKLGPIRCIDSYLMFSIVGGGAVEFDQNLREADAEDFALREDIEITIIPKRRKRRRIVNTIK